VNASSERELETAFATMVQAGAAAILIATDPSIDAMQEPIARLAVRHALPTMAGHRSYVVTGSLMSYDASATDSFRQVGVYVGRILKGEKPADLPVLQPTKFELVINLKTAKALGIEIPPKILALTDEAIE
jgi:putative ABC transport system substrate-binding protein